MVRHLNRVTDTCIPEEEAIRRMERAMLEEWLRAEGRAKAISPTNFSTGSCCRQAQAVLPDRPKGQLAAGRCEKDLPIVVPGWEDSTLGNTFASHVIEAKSRMCIRFARASSTW